MKILPNSEDVQKSLLTLAEEHGGILNPHDVVDAARPADSILHSYFTWDDTEAARQHRLSEARFLIRVHVQTIEVEGKDVETRVFVSLSTDRNGSGGYRTMTAVMSDEENRRQLISDALRDLRTFEARYASLRELSKVVQPIKKFIMLQEQKQLSRTA